MYQNPNELFGQPNIRCPVSGALLAPDGLGYICLALCGHPYQNVEYFYHRREFPPVFQSIQLTNPEVMTILIFITVDLFYLLLNIK